MLYLPIRVVTLLIAAICLAWIAAATVQLAFDATLIAIRTTPQAWAGQCLTGGAVAYAAWYINWGRHPVHFWIASALVGLMTLMAVTWYGLVFHVAERAVDRERALAWGFGAILFWTTFAIGIYLRQPRLRALRLRDARWHGDLEALAHGLDDRFALVRQAAAYWLGTMGQNALPALPSLRAARYDARGSVRLAVQTAIAKIEAPPREFLPAGATVEAPVIPPRAADASAIGDDDNPYRSPLG